MGRSRLPLVALLGAVGCTKQDAADPNDATPADDSPPWKLKGVRLNVGNEQEKGSGIRALTPEERASLVSRPIPVPEGAAAQAAPEPEARDAGTPPDYAEQRRRQFEQHYPDYVEEQQRGRRLEQRYFSGKGSGIQRSEPLIIRGTDGGTPNPVKN
jgi:hypothetical protein